MLEGADVEPIEAAPSVAAVATPAAVVVTLAAALAPCGTIESLMTPSLACETASFRASPTCSGTSVNAAIAMPSIAICARPFSRSCTTCAEITVPGCSVSCAVVMGVTGAVDTADEMGAIVAAMAESVAREAIRAALTPR